MESPLSAYGALQAYLVGEAIVRRTRRVAVSNACTIAAGGVGRMDRRREVAAKFAAMVTQDQTRSDPVRLH